MTKLIQKNNGFLILRGVTMPIAEKVCSKKDEAVKILEAFGISFFEIEDAFAAMKVNDTNGAEFGVNETFIRTFRQ